MRIPREEGDKSLSVLDLGDDGSVLLKQSDVTRSTTISQSTLLLRGAGGTHRDVSITTPAHPAPQQAIAADVSDQYVAWMETPSTELGVLPWVLYGFNRATGRALELASAPKLAGRLPPPPPGNTGPMLSGSHVYWAQVSGKPGAERVDVFGCLVLRCLPRKVLAGAAFPAVSGGSLFAVRAARFRGEATNGLASVVRLDLRTGLTSIVERMSLGQDEFPGGLAVEQNQLAWIVAGHPASITVLDLRSGRRSTFVSESEGSFGYPVMTSRYVAWSESSGTSAADVGGYLYDLKAEVLSSIGNTAGLYNVAGSGRAIAWQDSKTAIARPQDIVNVVARLR